MSEVPRSSDPLASVRRRQLLGTAVRIGAAGLVVPGTLAAAREAFRPSVASGDGTGFAGRALDVGTLSPVSGAKVTATPGGSVVTTGADGAYALSVPPGSYTVQVARDGYVGVIRRHQVASRGFLALDLQLVPRAPAGDQLALIYDRLVKQRATPLVDSRALNAPSLRIADLTLPSTITVYYDQASPPYVTTVALEDYVKGVVPNEVPWSWPTTTLQAQAVAARSYGVAYQAAYGYVYPDTRCQVYDPTQQTEPTNAAVDSTAGQVITYNGLVAWAFFYSSCNGMTTLNSEDALIQVPQPSGIYGCQPNPWNYVAYCRARPCGGHLPSPSSDCGYWGHGVGMCQWGAYARGTSSYQSILNDYYTGIVITSGSAPPTPTPLPTPTPTPPVLQCQGPTLVQVGWPITLRWSGDPTLPTYIVVYQGTGLIYQANVPNGVFSFTLPSSLQLPVGLYSWTINQGDMSLSVSATLEVAEKVYQGFVPAVSN